jgi:UDP-perosamine 4-acetyltransferase
MMERVVVIGGGGHAKVVIDVLKAAGWQVAGYTDPAPAAGGRIADVPCLGDDAALADLHAAGIPWAIVALGDNALRARMAERALALGFALARAVHPSAQISPSARLGAGVAVMPGAVVNAGSVLGDNTILNTSATVDHDCAVGRSVHIAPGAHLAGYVTVEDEALVGVGSIVGRGRPLRVGRGAVIGIGSVVFLDVPPGATVAGNPARPLRPARRAFREGDR